MQSRYIGEKQIQCIYVCTHAYIERYTLLYTNSIIEKKHNIYQQAHTHTHTLTYTHTYTITHTNKQTNKQTNKNKDLHGFFFGKETQT